MLVSVDKISVKDRRRGTDGRRVCELADSIRELGLLNPLTVTGDFTLIAGLHRLEAVKMLCWKEVACTVTSLEGLRLQLAEIDENFVRRGLSAVEYGETLLRRKEIYEALHPETKAGISQAAAMNRAIRNNVADNIAATTKSFVEDTAEKLGVAPRTVRRQIQTAKNLVPEAKEMMKESCARITQKEAMKLSRLQPGQQKEAVALLTGGHIQSVDEYTAETGRDAKQQAQSKEDHAAGHTAESMCNKEKEKCMSIREVVAELKDPDKDCSSTPDSFMAEYEAFVRKFQKEIAWYSDSYYDTVFPCMSDVQLVQLKQQTDVICAAAIRLFQKAERMKT